MTGRFTPSAANPDAVERLISCKVQSGIGEPLSCAIYRSNLGLAFENPCGGVFLGLNKNLESEKRGRLSMIATACGDNGTVCCLLFFERAAGIVQVRCSTLISSHVMPATSPRLWPVRIKSFVIGPNGKPS